MANYFILFAGIVCISTAPIIVIFANVAPSIATLYRVSIPAGVFLLASQVHEDSRIQTRSNLWVLKYAALSGMFFAINNTLFNASLSFTNTFNAVFLSNTGVIWVGILTLLLYRKRLPARFWFAACIAVAGVYFVSIAPGQVVVTFGLGEGLALGAALFYAALLISNERSRINSTTINHVFALNFSAFFLLLIFNLITKQTLWGYTPNKLVFLLLLALVPQLFGFFLISHAQKYISAAHTSIIILLQPVLSTLLAVIFLNEFFGILQIFGASLIIVGTYVGRQKSLLDGCKSSN